MTTETMLTHTFTRAVGGGAPPPALLGSDVDPSTLSGAAASNYTGDDNVIQVPVGTGGPLPKRLGIAVQYTGGGTAPTLTSSIYVWEALAGAWFPVVTSLSVPPSQETWAPIPAATERGYYAVVLTGSSPPNGTYAVSVGFDYAGSAGASATVSGTVTATAPANPAAVANHLASSTLPAAGAWTTQAVWTIESGTTEITATITYTRGAAGGYARARALWTTAGGEAEGTVEDLALDTSVAPIARTSLYLQEINLPAPADGSPLTFTRSFGVREAAPGATGFRLEVCEAGVPATPGTCAVALSGSKQ